MYRDSTKKIVPVKDSQKDDHYFNICSRLVNHIDAILMYWDKKEICQFANSSFLKLFGHSNSQVIGIFTLKELLGVSYLENKPYIKKVLDGKKQVFELLLRLGGDSHHFIVTYNPDKVKGKVVGFFTHMADINLIKKQDTKLLEYEKAKRREVLRSVIETQESEREMIAYELRDKVNQTLAYSKMMLGSATAKNSGKNLLTMISENIHETIDELNRISTNLTPSVITMIGFLAGMKEYINDVQKRYPVKITCKCEDEKIEQLSMNDKISIFRIVQNYLLILTRTVACKNISIEVKRAGSKLLLKMKHDNLKFELPLQSKEFVDIEHRLEYYDGAWQQFNEKNRKTLVIELEILV